MNQYSEQFRRGLLEFDFEFGLDAVSYTHLDVYKRQTESKRANRNQIRDESDAR